MPVLAYIIIFIGTGWTVLIWLYLVVLWLSVFSCQVVHVSFFGVLSTLLMIGHLVILWFVFKSLLTLACRALQRYTELVVGQPTVWIPIPMVFKFTLYSPPLVRECFLEVTHELQSICNSLTHRGCQAHVALVP